MHRKRVLWVWPRETFSVVVSEIDISDEFSRRCVLKKTLVGRRVLKRLFERQQNGEPTGRGGRNTSRVCALCFRRYRSIYFTRLVHVRVSKHRHRRHPLPPIRVRYISQTIAGYNCLELIGGDDTPTLPVRRDVNPPHKGQPQMFFWTHDDNGHGTRVYSNAPMYTSRGVITITRHARMDLCRIYAIVIIIISIA